MKKLFYIFTLMAAATLSFTACEDVPSPYDYPEAKTDTTQVIVDTTQVAPTGEGTAASPYNVAKLLDLYNGTLPTSDVYVVGIVSQIDEIDTGSYGNATYHISDKGTTANQFEIYRGYALNGDKFATGNEIKLGDTVVVKGTPVLYYSTKEMKQGSQIVSINGSDYNKGDEPTPSTDPAGEGTQASPYNVAKAIATAQALADGESTDEVYVSGTISQIRSIDTGSYGNAQYYISDDGTTANQFYIFRGFYLDGAKFTSEDQIKVGDKVVVRGKLVNYMGNTPEMAQGNQIVSLNNSGDTPVAAEGLSISGTTVTLTQGGATASATSVSVDLSTLGFSNAADVTTVTLSDGATIVFDGNGQRNAPKYYNATKGVRVYANNTIAFHGTQKIASITMECDSYNGTDYVGNTTATVTFSGNDALYTNVFEGTSGGGVQLRVQKITVTYAQ